jgi:hypothetical protein
MPKPRALSGRGGMLGLGEQTYKLFVSSGRELSPAGVGKWGKAVGGASGNP